MNESKGAAQSTSVDKLPRKIYERELAKLQKAKSALEEK